MHCLHYGLITAIFFSVSFVYTWIFLPTTVLRTDRTEAAENIQSKGRQSAPPMQLNANPLPGNQNENRDSLLLGKRNGTACDDEVESTLHAGVSARQLDYHQPRFIQRQEHLCQRTEDVPDGLFLLIQVHSHPAHKERRDAIRATWGSAARQFNTRLHIGLVFLLGVSNISQEINHAVTREGKLYRDIVQGSFADTYRNLTTKSIMGLHWTNTYCCDTAFVLKTDDDVYFNISLLLSFLQGLPRRGVLLGSIYEDSQVMREGQWQVNVIDFPFPVYPPYCAGAAYVMSPDVSQLLYSTFVTKMPKPLLTIEDAYVTGFLANSANMSCSHSDLFPNWMSTPSIKTLQKFFHRKVIAMHGVPYAAMYQIEKLIKLCTDCESNLSKLKDWFVWIGRNSTFGT